MTGHSAHDGAAYFLNHLWEEWGKRDPIALLERTMMDRGWIEAAQLEELRASLRREVDQAIVWAENSPYPDAGELLDNVYEKR